MNTVGQGAGVLAGRESVRDRCVLWRVGIGAPTSSRPLSKGPHRLVWAPQSQRGGIILSHRSPRELTPVAAA